MVVKVRVRLRKLIFVPVILTRVFESADMW
jgi:hypothetical protein